MGADQNFSRNQFVGLYPKNHHKPSNLGRESSYGPAISLRKALGSYAKAKESIRCKSQNSTTWTSLTGAMDRSYRSWPEQVLTGLTGLAVRSDRCHPEKPVNKTSKEESQANKVQIQ